MGPLEIPRISHGGPSRRPQLRNDERLENYTVDPRLKQIGHGVAPSEQLAKEWGPYIETSIEAFGAKRAMFESNFPEDEVSCDYPTLWNALKRVASGASADEKRELFFGTANRFYRLGL